MTVEELKSNGINNLFSASEFLKSNYEKGVLFIPDTISKVISELIKEEESTSIIILNSNFGEISSKVSKSKNLINIDINSNNVEISKYLNPSLNFLNENPLTYKENKFDYVVTFPPLGQRIKEDGRQIPNEILYVEKALKLLNEKGTAILILPNSFLTAKIYLGIRNFITENLGLVRLFTLPIGIIRNTGSELSILEVSKSKTTETKFYKLNSDFDKNISIPSFTIQKKELTERWDFNFHNPENQKHKKILIEFATKKISELLDVHLGTPVHNNERKQNGEYKILTPRNIKNGFLEESQNDNFIEKDVLNKREERAIIRNGDILFPRYNRDKVSIYTHQSDDDNKYIANQHIIIFRGKNAEYVKTYLNTESGLKLFNQQIKQQARGNVVSIISLEDLRNIQIPILPINDFEYASERKLTNLSINELLNIKNEYELLKVKYSNIKTQKNTIPQEEFLNSLESMLIQVLKNQKEHSENLLNIENKIDDVKSFLQNLSSDFKEIKELPRDIEEKITRLNKKLEEKITSINFEQIKIDNYIQEIKNWFEYYDLLESKSQKYLPEAEYILDHISKLDNPDYSPFILQYCRALENELLSKIFRAYVQSLIDKNIIFEKEFAWDLGKKESGKPNDENTYKLSKHIQKCLTKMQDEWFFELGTMEINLRFLTGKTLAKSPLLKDLKQFILIKFEEELLNINYLDEIKTIIRDYRNQSAHPNIMDEEKARLFHKQMKECLINLMEKYKI